MSERTRCNYCTLESIKAEHPEQRVETVPKDGWLQVTVDGEEIGVLFLALTGGCVC